MPTIGTPETLDAVDEVAGPYEVGDRDGRIVFQVYGTFVATITWEGKQRGVPDVAANWIAIQATNKNSGAAATTATAPGIYRIDADGLMVRGRMSAYTSGAASVVGDVIDN